MGNGPPVGGDNPNLFSFGQGDPQLNKGGAGRLALERDEYANISRLHIGDNLNPVSRPLIRARSCAADVRWPIYPRTGRSNPGATEHLPERKPFGL